MNAGTNDVAGGAWASPGYAQRAIAYLKAALPPSGCPDVQTLPAPDEPVLKDLRNGLCAAYVVDDNEGLVFVQNRHLAQDGIDDETLHVIGLDNLCRIANEHLQIQQHGPIFGVFVEGNFEASMLLIDQLWDESFAELAPNGFAAIVPSRDVLAFCDCRSAEGLAVLREMVARLKASGAAILSESLYFRRNGAWVAAEHGGHPGN